MKNSVLLILLLSSLTIQAQNYQPYQKSNTEVKPMYFGLGTGLNSLHGLVGLSMETYLSDKLTAHAGAGLGSWGYKLSLGVRVYTRRTESSASGILFAFSKATGLNKAQLTSEVVTGSGSTITVNNLLVNLSPIYLAHVAYTKAWFLRNGNKINLDLGVCFQLNSGDEHYSIYDKTLGYHFSDKQDQAYKAIEPGGLFVGFGYAWGM